MLLNVQGRVVLDVEEVGAAQVGVTLVLAGVDARGVDRHLHRGLLGYLGDVHRSREGAEAAPDLGDHEVAGDELHGGVGLVEVVDARRRGRRRPGTPGSSWCAGLVVDVVMGLPPEIVAARKFELHKHRTPR